MPHLKCLINHIIIENVEYMLMHKNNVKRHYFHQKRGVIAKTSAKYRFVSLTNQIRGPDSGSKTNDQFFEYFSTIKLIAQAY